VPLPATLHPTENRGLRELYALGRQLVTHWSTLARRLGPGTAASALGEGVDQVRALIAALEELTADYQLFGSPAAQGVGVQLAGVRNGVADLFLERNQALRMAVLDVTHLIELLAYLGAVAEGRRDERLADFCRGWGGRLAPVGDAVRAAVRDLARDPDAAIEPATPTPLGRAAHRVAYGLGTMGEWIDRRSAARRRS
jgi:hypothetical protein